MVVFHLLLKRSFERILNHALVLVYGGRVFRLFSAGDFWSSSVLTNAKVIAVFRKSYDWAHKYTPFYPQYLYALCVYLLTLRAVPPHWGRLKMCQLGHFIVYIFNNWHYLGRQLTFKVNFLEL